MTEPLIREVILKTGYINKKEPGSKPIRRALFSKRITAAEFIRIEDSEQGKSDVQKPLLQARASITEWGDEKRSPFLSELLGLTSSDRMALINAHVEFLGDSLGDRTVEEIDDVTLKLAYGLEEEGVTYNIVTFGDGGSLLDGYEERRIETEAGGKFEMACMLLGYDVLKLSSQDGAEAIPGPLDIDLTRRLDFYDLTEMMGFAARRRQRFQG